jgi:hypothetical protein
MPDAKAKHIHGRPRQLICAALLNGSAFALLLTATGQLKCAALELMEVSPNALLCFHHYQRICAAFGALAWAAWWL